MDIACSLLQWHGMVWYLPAIRLSSCAIMWAFGHCYSCRLMQSGKMHVCTYIEALDDERLMQASSSHARQCVMASLTPLFGPGGSLSLSLLYARLGARLDSSEPMSYIRASQHQNIPCLHPPSSIHNPQSFILPEAR